MSEYKQKPKEARVKDLFNTLNALIFWEFLWEFLEVTEASFKSKEREMAQKLFHFIQRFAVNKMQQPACDNDQHAIIRQLIESSKAQQRLLEGNLDGFIIYDKDGSVLGILCPYFKVEYSQDNTHKNYSFELVPRWLDGMHVDYDEDGDIEQDTIPFLDSYPRELNHVYNRSCSKCAQLVSFDDIESHDWITCDGNGELQLQGISGWKTTHEDELSIQHITCHNQNK